MKKTDWAILAGTAAYTLLFFEQHSGVNCVLFTLILIALLFYANKDVRNNRDWYLFAACALFSSVCVFVHSSALALFSLIVCWFVLSAKAAASKSTLINDLFTATFSVLSSIVLFFKRVFDTIANKKSEPADKGGVKALIYIISVILLLLFFILYKKANPLFENYTRKINLDFVSIQWALFTVWGFLFLYGLLRHERMSKMDEWEKRQEIPLSEGPVSVVHKYLGQGFTFLFVLLNLMLLFINILDINFLYLGSGLPEGITHKQFVHDGVNNLILSILLGISVILYVFRGALNFDRGNRLLKILVYVWLLQNVMMIFSTALRNHMYITEALLTYKRIGVYYWLALAFSGLITTFVKVRSVLPNWYLIRKNSVVAFLLLVGSSAIDWDLLISRYNISHASEVASLDKKYLISLSEGNIGLLYPLRNHPEFETDSVWHYESYYKNSNRKTLDEKLYSFLKKHHTHGDWRSLNRRETKTHNWIVEHQMMIDSLDLIEIRKPDINCFFELKNIKYLNLPNGFPFNDSTVKILASHSSLQSISLYSLGQDQLILFNDLPQLKKVQIRSTNWEVLKIKEKLREQYPKIKVE